MPVFVQDTCSFLLSFPASCGYADWQDPSSHLSADLHTMLRPGLRDKGVQVAMTCLEAMPSQFLKGMLRVTGSGARELENEREIAQYFKAAVAAAEEAMKPVD